MVHWLAASTAEHEVVIRTWVMIELRSVVSRSLMSRKLNPPIPDRQLTELLEAMSGFAVASTNATLVLKRWAGK